MPCSFGLMKFERFALSLSKRFDRLRLNGFFDFNGPEQQGSLQGLRNPALAEPRSTVHGITG